MTITDLVRFPNSFASESYTASHNYKHNHNHSQRLHKLRSLWSQGNYLFLFLYCIQDNPRESKRIQENIMLSFKTTYQSTNPPDPTIYVLWMRVCFVNFLSSRRKIQILPITGANIIMMCIFFLAPKLTEHQQQHQA